ncbi:MAG: T9SS type A sorting domain-containing protein [Bacteroidia bacterium]|nr:T9SS type A sorting domain-containing protein [Bacteroidia bacterium]
MKNKFIYALIIFAFYSANCFSQYGGSLVFYSNIDFESTLDTNLKIIFNNDTNDLWQIGRPNKSFANSSYTLPNAIITDTISPFIGQNDSWFDIKINTHLWMGQAMQLDFLHKYENDSLHSKCFVEISYDQGFSWLNVIENQNVGMGQIYYDNLYSSNDTSEFGVAGFSGNCNDWQFSSVYWIWEASAKNICDTVIVRFHFISDSLATTGGGWVIDNIHILGFINAWSIPKNFENSDIVIYPNPIVDQAVIEFKNPIKKLFIYDRVGRMVLSEDICNDYFIIKKEELGSGVFVIKLLNNNGKESTKTIVIE